MGGDDLLFGPGSITQGQLVALTSLTLVLVFLVSANMAVWWLYRRAASQDERRRRRNHRQKTSSVWVYHVHRTPHVASRSSETPAQQILRKLQASHHNLRAKVAAASSLGDARRDSLRREEAQALEELDVTTNLFLHDTICSASRRSSLSAVSGSRTDSSRLSAREVNNRLVSKDPASRKSGSGSASVLLDLRPVLTSDDLEPEFEWDFDTASTSRVSDTASALQELDSAFAGHDLDLSTCSYDHDVASALADLDTAAAMHDLDTDTDKVSVSSVTMADFENDDHTTFLEDLPRRKKLRRSKRRSSGKGDHSRSLPVAEFHNEAFDLSETGAAVERMKDVEL